MGKAGCLNFAHLIITLKHLPRLSHAGSGLIPSQIASQWILKSLYEAGTSVFLFLLMRTLRLRELNDLAKPTLICQVGELSLTQVLGTTKAQRIKWLGQAKANMPGGRAEFDSGARHLWADSCWTHDKPWPCLLCVYSDSSLNLASSLDNGHLRRSSYYMTKSHG